MDTREHWEAVYRATPVTEVSWYQAEARQSLELIARVAPDPASAIVDVGGGASTLVDSLLARGYRDLTVLDLAPAALDAARVRLGPQAERVRWEAGDVLTHPFTPRSVDVWHDRAVFHFLTAPRDRETYVSQAARALRPEGHLILATFAADGPTRCSGLEVCRYDPQSLHRELGGAFELLSHVREDHCTPAGRVQRFQYCIFVFRPPPEGVPQ